MEVEGESDPLREPLLDKNKSDSLGEPFLMDYFGFEGEPQNQSFDNHDNNVFQINNYSEVKKFVLY